MVAATSDSFKFEGFEPANTTPVPDVFFDELLPHLSEAQLKAMLYIIRRTLGFKKTSDAISLKQFRYGITTREGKQLDQGCGLRNFTSITRALNDLEAMGCVERDKSDTDDGDPATTLYRIRFRGTTPSGVPTTTNGVPPTASGVPTTRNGVPRALQEVDGPHYAKRRAGTTRNGGRVLRETEPQETELQLDSKQQTDDKSDCAAPASPGPNDSLGQSSSNSQQEASPPSRLHIAPHTEDFLPVVPSMPVHSSQGYKTDDSVGTVMQNSTVGVSRTLQISAWIDDLGILSDKAKRDGYVARLAKSPHLNSIEAMMSLRDRAEAELVARYGEYKRAFLGNMVGILADWEKAEEDKERGRSPGQAAQSSKTMNHEEAEALALSLLALYPRELLGTCQAYPDDDNIWLLALRFDAGDKDWVVFENEEHYRNPSAWELERIIDARVWAREIFAEQCQAVGM